MLKGVKLMDWLSRLKEMKQRCGLTTKEISEGSGIPEPTLEKLFAGATKDPKLNTMQQLVHFLGYTLDDLAPPSAEKEKSPNPEATGSGEDKELSKEDEQLYLNIRRVLENGGLIEPGKPLNSDQAEGIIAILRLLRILFKNSPENI